MIVLKMKRRVIMWGSWLFPILIRINRNSRSRFRIVSLGTSFRALRLLNTEPRLDGIEALVVIELLVSVRNKL